MKRSIEFLDEVKARYGLTSDYQLAKFLEVGHSTVSHYRTGRSRMDNAMCVKVAGYLDRDPLVLIAAVEFERATRPELKEVWKGLAERVAGVTIALVAAWALTTVGSDFFTSTLFASVDLEIQTPTYALLEVAEISGPLCIM